jgi:glycosyltransferase involved in cell wall biosynthesis
VSRALAGKAQELGVPGDQIWIVYNGVDGELFRVRDRAAARRELGLPAEARIALYVGNLKESKGVRDLVRGFPAAAARAAGLHLAIVGDGGERALCDQLAAQLPGRVTVAGARPLAEIPTWLAACDLLVLPSWNEGTPNVVLEALSCGRRVVATAVGGVPDVIDDAVLGALVAPRQPDRLADALVREAAVDYRPDEVAERGGRGDWAASADRLLAVLERVVGR